MKGSMSDPVAQSIRAEQNMDAAPTPEEAEREKNRFLRSTGCTNCECSDVDKLGMVFLPQPELAQPNPNPDVVVCDDCKDEVLEEAQEKADKADEFERERRERRHA